MNNYTAINHISMTKLKIHKKTCILVMFTFASTKNV